MLTVDRYAGDTALIKKKKVKQNYNNSLTT